MFQEGGRFPVTGRQTVEADTRHATARELGVCPWDAIHLSGATVDTLRWQNGESAAAFCSFNDRVGSRVGRQFACSGDQ